MRTDMECKELTDSEKVNRILDIIKECHDSGYPSPSSNPYLKEDGTMMSLKEIREKHKERNGILLSSFK